MKRVQKILSLLILILCLYVLPSFADVGDFETYDSGWSSSDSWSSDVWDDDDWYESSSSRYNNFHIITFPGDIVVFIFVAFIFVMFFILKYIKINEKDINVREKTKSEDEVINEIKAIDEMFNPEEFKSKVKELYIKMQYAWSDRDWESMRYLETKELYEQHSRQIERYIQEGQINKIERVAVNWVKFANFYQAGDKDIITVILNSKMIDYIIDEKTKNIIKGNNSENKINDYKLVFVRTTGIKSKPSTENYSISNCPNCGAPTEISSSGKCSYCGCVLVNGQNDWLLSSLERY